jgi:uncharacterized protein YhaN
VRLAKLALLAYGPFTGQIIDFGPPGRLTVVYGANEAGKSTTLRAIEAFLFGIEHRTVDAHLHKGTDLRIGATLVGPLGEPFEAQRKKSTGRSLLDAAGEELIDEAPLLRMLGGTTRETFRSVYGLDEARLREGGRVLLEGKGSVGETLFSASLGVAHVKRVLSELEEGAERLFAARGKREINLRIAQYKQRMDLVERVHSTPPEKVLDQEKEIATFQQALAALRVKQRALEAERAKLSRAVRTIPWTERLAAANAALERLGHAPRIDGEARARHEEAERVARAAAARIEAQIAERSARLAAIGELPVLLEHALDVETLVRERATYANAERERPAARRERERLEAEIGPVAARLGTSAAGDPMDAPARTRLRRLAERLTAAVTAQRAAEEAASRAAQGVAAAAARRARLGAVDRDRERALRAALAEAREPAKLEAALEAAAKERERGEAALSAARARLCVDGVDPALLWAPAPETVEGHAEAMRRAHARLSDLAAKRDALVGRLIALHREEQRVRGSEPVPSEEALAAARAARDAAIEALGAGGGSLGAAVRATAQADAIVDELRREADRLAHLARLSAERASLQEEERAIFAELEAASRAVRDEESRWQKVWARTAAPPMAPADARAWIAELAEARRAAELLRAAAAEEATCRERVERARRVLAQALAIDLGDLGPGALAEEARAELVRIERAAEALAAADEEARRLEQEFAAARERAVRAGEEVRRVREEATTLLAEHGITAPVHEELATIADDVDALAAGLERIRSQARREAVMDRDAREIEAKVRAVSARAAPDLSGRPVIAVIDELQRRLEAASRARDERARLERELYAAEAELAEERARIDAATAALDAMAAAAGVASRSDLAAAERAGAEAAAQLARRREAEEALERLGDGLSPSALADEAGEHESLEAAQRRLEDVEAELDDVLTQIDRTGREIAGKEAGLAMYREGVALAADERALAEADLAAIQEKAEEWVRLRLAHRVLSRAVDRYRERSQGPLLRRAGELFSELTLGAFVRLAVRFDEDDKPRLAAVRSGGGDVEVEGMSEGTRDQLYLALRIASLERMIETTDPLPLVLDDVLVQFDDDRAAAALRVLARLAGRMQVLFFTHHAHLVEIARRTLPADQLTVTTLGGAEPGALVYGAPPS